MSTPDTTVLTPPDGLLNWQASQGLVPSVVPSDGLLAGDMLVTVDDTQQALVDWLGGIPSLPIPPSEGGTGATSLGPSSFGNDAGVLTARSAARMQLQWPAGAVVQNDTVYFCYDAPYPGRINTLTYFAGVGSFTLAVQINGVSVTGLAAVSVASSAPATSNASALNTFTAGQRISGVITGAASSPADVLLSLAVTWAD
jgi:hypothetical protein